MEQPMFGRLSPEITMIQKQKEGRNYSRDDEIHIVRFHPKGTRNVIRMPPRTLNREPSGMACATFLSWSMRHFTTSCVSLDEPYRCSYGSEVLPPRHFPVGITRYMIHTKLILRFRGLESKVFGVRNGCDFD
jgi:hypothetical protein